MPKLNKIRLAHIQYNDGQDVITDQVFHLDGNQTLLKLVNGGGKSVLTQMLLAPYLSSTTLRNFKDRPFFDYFKMKKPSFILQEWAMDQGPGKFVVGLMVRKSQTVQDGEEDGAKSDFYAFVGEYQKEEPWSLESLPLLEEHQGQKGYLGFQQARTMLERFASDGSIPFRLFNLNNSEHRKSYARTLKQLGLERAEWDQMRAFNQDESGLSKFFENNRTEAKLLSQVFLPAAANKLDLLAQTAETHMDSFGKAVSSYLDQRLQNVESLDRLKVWSALARSLESMEDLVQTARQAANRQRENRRALLSFAKSLELTMETLVQQDRQTQALLDQARTSLQSIRHERLSLQWHRSQERLETLRQMQHQEESRNQQISTRTTQLERDLGLLNARNTWKDCRQLEEACIYWQTRLAACQQSQQATQQQLERVGASLKQVWAQKLESGQEQLETARAQLENLLLNQTTIAGKNRACQERVNALTLQQNMLEQELEQYRKEEGKYQNLYGRRLVHTLTEWEDHKVLSQEHIWLQTQRQEARKDLEEIQDHLEADRTLKQEKDQTLYQLGLQAITLEKERERLEEKQKTEQAFLAVRQDLFKILDLESTNLFQPADKALDQYRQEKDSQMQNSYRILQEFRQKKEQLETGCTLMISPAIRDVMDQLGIDLITGTEWLRASSLHHKTKLRLAREFPFLPYGLVMETSQIQMLLEELKARGLNTSQPLPLIARSSLNQPPQSPVMDGVEFYLCFNQELLLPNQVARLVKEVQEQMEQERQYAKTLQSQKQQVESLVLKSRLEWTLQDHDALAGQIQSN